MTTIILALMLSVGQPIELPHVYTMNASAYCPGPCCNGPYKNTALGTPIKPGVIAVDPKVIPLRSWVWVEGRGIYQAMDTGGAIKGQRIDIAHTTHAAALEFGRRPLKVFVIKEG